MIRPFERKDLKELSELASSVLSPTSEDLLRWLFVNNPFIPNGGINFVLERDSKIVGMAFNIFAGLKFYDKIYNARWAYFFVTHPDYRGSGIELAEQYVGLPVYPFFAFSSKKQFAWEARFGFEKIAYIYSYICIIDFSKIMKSKLGNCILFGLIGRVLNLAAGLWRKARNYRRQHGYTLEYISDFDDRFNDLWGRCCQDYSILVKRDKEYLSWRFAYNPSKYKIISLAKDKQIQGYIVINIKDKNGIKRGIVLDLLADGEDKDAVVDILLQEALEYFIKNECYSADFLILATLKPYIKAMRRNGFVFRRFRSTFVVYNKFEGDFIKLKNRKNWFITRSDSDLELCD